MLATYKAILQDDHLRWLDEAPTLPANGAGITVLVTITEPLAATSMSSVQQEVLNILERLAARGTMAELADPLAWQREQRTERGLPGRD
jgi:hypothetical protein